MISLNYLTIDVEDYYHVSAFEDIVAKTDWDKYPSRVEKNTQNILAIFHKHNVKGTFFILGWVAEKHPQLIKDISAAGHEIACHSYRHQLVYNLTPEEFREDTHRAKSILEQLTDLVVRGYRAPSYSITRKSLWALPILHELGFEYDSSVFPIYHDIYGIPDAPRFAFLWNLSGSTPEILVDSESGQSKDNTTLREFPVSTASLLGRNLPVSGGGYFRLFPYWLTRKALQEISIRDQKPFIFYLHPWEVDPDQPRMSNARAFSKFRHYNNLCKTSGRLERLLHDFKFGPIAFALDN